MTEKTESKVLLFAMAFSLICEAIYIITAYIWPLLCVPQILMCGLCGIVLSLAEYELCDIRKVRLHQQEKKNNSGSYMSAIIAGILCEIIMILGFVRERLSGRAASFTMLVLMSSVYVILILQALKFILPITSCKEENMVEMENLTEMDEKRENIQTLMLVLVWVVIAMTTAIRFMF